MENDETMIGTDETMTEDLPDGLIEDEDASEETLEESLEEETPEESAEEQPKTEGTTEPGYVKKRIDKAVAKAVAETENTYCIPKEWYMLKSFIDGKKEYIKGAKKISVP